VSRGRSATVARRGRTLPAIPRHEVVDQELRQRATRIETDFLTLCELVQEVADGAFYARFGFQDLDGYLEERIGLSYRSVRRRLTVLEAIRALPPADQDAAKVSLAALGASKAAVLAPMVKRPGVDWRTWAETAASTPVASLQAQVSRELGLRPRGAADAPGTRFLAYVLNQVPPDVREEVQVVFDAVAEVAGSTNAVEHFLLILAEAKAGILQQLASKRRGHGA
jgi:hypothetical protein